LGKMLLDKLKYIFIFDRAYLVLYSQLSQFNENVQENEETS
jgi:hypothetical protein